MEVSGQFHVLATVPIDGHFVEGWVSPGTGLDHVGKGRSHPYGDSNSDPLAFSS
jgi:hypothetical protein